MQIEQLVMKSGKGLTGEELEQTLYLCMRSIQGAVRRPPPPSSLSTAGGTRRDRRR